MENSVHYRPTRAIVNLKAIQNNVLSLKKYVGNKTSIIAVVKADGYGHGEAQVANAAFKAGAEMVAVATPDEALNLRMAGITGDILVMGTSPVTFAPKAAELEITITVSDAEWLKEVIKEAAFSNLLKIHVKIDSGMGRIGLRSAQDLQSIISVVEETEQIEIDGMFTHFACADEEDSMATKEQYNVFMDLVSTLPEKPRLIHASNSAATLLYPELALDAVRFGISLYGIAPSDYVQEHLPFQLERALTIESEIAFVKQLDKGERISYGGTYETIDKEWIGTIPIGYADGLRRGLRGQEVLINGERMPLVGTICMDQCMVKLSKQYAIGEKVTFLGTQGDDEIKMEEWASKLNTIPYEIAVSIMKRVPRIYTK